MFLRKEAKRKDNWISELLGIIQSGRTVSVSMETEKSISTSKSVIDSLHEHLFSFKEELQETALLIRSLVFKNANNGDKVDIALMGEDINEKPPKLETTYGTHYHENNIWTMVPNDMRKFSLSKFPKKSNVETHLSCSLYTLCLIM